MIWVDEVFVGYFFVVVYCGVLVVWLEYIFVVYDLVFKEGVDGVECDVWLIWDGYLVCVYDCCLD